MLPSALLSKKMAERHRKRKRSHTDPGKRQEHPSIVTRKRRRVISRGSPMTNHSTKCRPKDLFSPFLLGNETICKHISSYLHAPDFINLTQTSKNVRALLRDHRWDINRRLERFFDQPDAFRIALGKTNAFIGGDIALQLFQSSTRLDATLDIFVEKGARADRLHTHLTHMEDYRLLSTSLSMYGNETWLDKITTYNRNRDRFGPVAIRLLETEDIPMQAFLKHTYDTAACSLITWNKAYSIFPFATFVQRRLYMLRPLDEVFASHLRTYRRHGWKLDDIVRPLSDPTEIEYCAPNLPTCMTANRRLGDRHCWTVPLGNPVESGGLPSPDPPDAEINTFHMSTDNLGDVYSTCFPIVADVITHVMLHFNYTYSRKDWVEALETRLSDMLAFELVTLPPHLRPDMLPLERRSQLDGWPTPMPFNTQDAGFPPGRGVLKNLPRNCECADHLLKTWYENYISARPEFNEDSDRNPGQVYLTS